MKALVIYNPISGKRTKYDICKLYEKILKDYGYDPVIIKTEYAGHAKEIVKGCQNFDIVFSIGGDGTLNEIISGNFERKDKLSICPLPSGSCNDVASMLGYGKNPKKNLKAALNGELHDFDIGTINNKPFIYVAGLGKFMNVSYESDPKEKAKIGYLSYLKFAAKELIKKIKVYTADITIDNQHITGQYSIIMVSNSNHIAGISNFYKNISLNDNEFEVFLCNSNNMVDMVINFIKFYFGLKTDQIISLNGHDINIKINNEKTDWCVDGEKLSQAVKNYTIKVDTKMRLLTPKKPTKKDLF